MKGLIIKDIYMALKYCKFLFLIDVVFIVMSFLSADNIMFMMFPILFSGVIPITLLSCDERCGWTVYSGTLPYSGAQIVSAKYITGLLIGIVSSAVIMGLMTLRMSVMGSEDIAGALIGVGAVFVASLLIPAVCLPFCFKFGTEKGRIVYFVVIILVITGIGSFAGSKGTFENIKGIMPIIPAAIALLYIASLVISVMLCGSKTASR